LPTQPPRNSKPTSSGAFCEINDAISTSKILKETRNTKGRTEFWEGVTHF
jgi:hypothetical protein